MTAEPRTYAAYLSESKRRQRAHIASEQERYAEAARLFTLYKMGMLLLELHPLDWSEITDRRSQLERMAATVEETHGDNEKQRALWAAMKDEETLHRKLIDAAYSPRRRK